MDKFVRYCCGCLLPHLHCTIEMPSCSIKMPDCGALRQFPAVSKLQLSKTNRFSRRHLAAEQHIYSCFVLESTTCIISLIVDPPIPSACHHCVCLLTVPLFLQCKRGVRCAAPSRKTAYQRYAKAAEPSTLAKSILQGRVNSLTDVSTPTHPHPLQACDTECSFSWSGTRLKRVKVNFIPSLVCALKERHPGDLLKCGHAPRLDRITP